MPMGIDPAPFWANIYLYNYEAKFVTELVKSNNTQNKIIARKFHSTNRFIDDLCALNDGGEFGRQHKNIYSSEMELKKNTRVSMPHFLTLKPMLRIIFLCTNYTISVIVSLFPSLGCHICPATSPIVFFITRFFLKCFVSRDVLCCIKTFCLKLKSFASA